MSEQNNKKRSAIAAAIVADYQRKYESGLAREAVLADIVERLRKAPDAMEVARGLFHIVCALRTVCRYGPRATALAVEAIKPGVEGTKLVAAAEVWMRKREQRHLEEIGDAEFWEAAFTRKLRSTRTDRSKKAKE